MTSVSGISGISTESSMSSTINKTLGKDDFLNLMITQLKYQDPLEPTSNEDFIAQLAQFSSLEQMANMNKGFEDLAEVQESMLRESTIAQAINLIGKTVSAILPVDMISGKISIEQTGFYLAADDTSMMLQTLGKDTPVTILGSEGQMYKVLLEDGSQGYVAADALTIDDNPRLTGVATGMKLIDGAAYVTINGEDISITQVEEVKLTAQGGAD
ncbi:flagellar hook assembly protein FlgD [Phosphitispora sp. TUW77]|uniref:flagellar hook assembly protein FlgD n=1 Tax=Phosphitispora sp. TUW77 TaxID=3152361 RepID=UPI003AB51741